MKTQFTTASTSAKRNAVQNPAMKNPGTRNDASMTRHALMTSEKRPSVRIFIGSVRTRRIGRIKRFNAPRTIAAISAPTSVTATPGTIYAAIRIARAEMSQWKNIFIPLEVGNRRFPYDY